MTPKALSDKIENAILSANVRYARQIIGVQDQLYDDLVRILKDLELDAEGYIKQSAVNRKVLKDAQNSFDRIITKSRYNDFIEQHLRVIPTINSLNEEYFTAIAKSFSSNKNFIKSLQTQTIETVNSYLLQDGLASQVKLPLNQILSQNINSGTSFSGMLKQLRSFIEGEPNEGKLLSYSKQILKDALFQYSRSFQESVTADLKLDWYLFSGPVVTGGKGSEGSRGWCLERKGKFFHRSEIEAWASEEWKGKNPLTTQASIFILVGGYNCVDSLIPVHESIVPEEDKERIIQ